MDANEKDQDALRTGQPSGSGTQEPSSYTEAQVRERHSALDKKISTLEKSHASKDAELAGLKEQMAQIQREKDEADMERFQDDPEGLKAAQERKAHRETKAELARTRQEIEHLKVAEAEHLKASQRDREGEAIKALAAKYGVDAKKLTNLLEGIPEERREGIAEALATKPAFKPDSSIGSGSVVKLGDLSPIELLKEVDRKLRGQ